MTVRELGDNNLRDLSKYITEHLHKSTTKRQRTSQTTQPSATRFKKIEMRLWSDSAMFKTGWGIESELECLKSLFRSNDRCGLEHLYVQLIKIR